MRKFGSHIEKSASSFSYCNQQKEIAGWTTGKKPLKGGEKPREGEYVVPTNGQCAKNREKGTVLNRLTYRQTKGGRG